MIDHGFLRADRRHSSFLQVRTGDGAKPPHRLGGVEIKGTSEALAVEFNQVLTDLRGEIGERKRKNLEVLRKGVLEALAEGGEVARESREALNYV